MLYYKAESILIHDMYIANTLASQNLLKMFTNVTQMHIVTTQNVKLL
jgi:hypothetical protein